MSFKAMGFAFAMVSLLVGKTVLAGGMAVVDMDKVIKSHPKTKTDRAILQQYIDDFDAEREELMTQMETLAGEFEELRTASEDDALSQEKRDAKRELAKLKLEERMKLERKVRTMAMERQKELTNRELQMRKRVVAQVTKVVKQVADDAGAGWVFSSSESQADAFPLVVIAPDAADLTDKVLEAIVSQGNQKVSAE